MGLRKEYGLPPDPVIEYYKKDVDRSLLRENLKLTPAQRFDKLVAFMRSLDELRTAGAKPGMMPDLTGLVRVLSAGGVRYIIVGGVAASLHGALRTTLDLDVVYDRDPENVARLVRALAPYLSYLRGAPSGLPFRLDEETVARGLNFTLVTALGNLDLLGEVTGGRATSIGCRRSPSRCGSPASNARSCHCLS